MKRLYMINRSYKHNSEYGQLMKKLVDAEGQLLGMLNDTQKCLFAAFSEAQSGLNSLTATDNFVYGYRLGVLMTVEVFTDNNNIVTGGEV